MLILKISTVKFFNVEVRMLPTHPPALSVRLREGTRESHRLAESTPFIREFFAARLPLKAYRTFLVQLRLVYSALESHSEWMQSHPALRLINFPSLHRRAALEQDLTFYFGGEAWREIHPLTATQAYAERIQTIANDWPPGLAAHHYTRYLGDLSGGQALKRIVAKMYQLDSENGLAFYNFPQIPDHAAFKNEFRARLDAMPIDEPAAQRLVEEANHAFELNRRMFAVMMEQMTPAPVS